MKILLKEALNYLIEFNMVMVKHIVTGLSLFLFNKEDGLLRVGETLSKTFLVREDEVAYYD